MHIATCFCVVKTHIINIKFMKAERGPWGLSSYRGNCSGWKYKVSKLAELFAGSGTGYDVCKDMNIQYIGADINPDPVRM